jgi:two-component system, NtrC family, nitrogen regulation sensor histidine kinase NtrY
VKPRLRYILFSKYSLLFLAAILFSLSFIFNKLYTNRSSVTREVRLLEQYLDRHEDNFNRFLKDTSLIRKLVEKRESLDEFNHLATRPYGIFLYRANEFGGVNLTFWSDQLAVPPTEIFAAEDGEYFHELSNGSYVTVKRTIAVSGVSDKILAFAMIPVWSEFFIETDYLPKTFAYSNTAAKRVMISDRQTEFPIISSSGKKLFYLDKKVSGAVPFNDRPTIFLRLGGVILLFLFLHLLAESVAKRKGAWRGIALLATIVTGLRVLSYFYPSLLNLRQFELFNPAIYGSTIVQRSLGDLLVNASLFCWIVLFAWSRLHNNTEPMAGFSKPLRWAIGLFSLCLLIYSTFILSVVIRSIIADSKISFDVTDFFSLNRYTVFGFVVLACLVLSYYYFTQLLFRLIFPLFEGRTIIIYFVIGFVGLVYLTARSGDPTVLFYLPVLVWLLGYTWLVNRQGMIFTRFRINIAGILFWIFVFSISIAAIMLAENKKAEWERRKNFATKQVDQTDYSSELLLNIALQYLDTDFLQDNYYRFQDPIKSKFIRDSILTENYAGYLDKYDTRLFVYDSANRSVNNDDATSYDDLNTLLTVQAQQAETPGLYYYETSVDKFIYITRRNIIDTAGQMKGSLFILSNPKRFSSDALFPELFKQFRQNDLESSPIYSYALYRNKQLVSLSNKYPFPIWITDDQIPKEDFQRKVRGDYDELWYRAPGKEKVVVIPRKRDTIIETITLFSYIFCSLLFLVAIVQFISLVLKAITNRERFRKLLQLNIRSQVHGTIIFISIFSFLIIGISTISFFISRSERNNTDKLSRTMKIMVNEMQKEQADHSTFDDVLKIYDTVANSNLQKLVDDVSEIHGVDVNVYDLHGDLKVSSEANVYTKGVLSRKMDPSAYYHLDRLRYVIHSQEEKIANFSYLSVYAPVRDEQGQAQAYVNIPYFTSTPELNQEISNFLVTLINLNAFIFLIAGLIALLITNRITRSFSIISDKMKEVNLGKLNEEITWNRNDEIGELVKEYNKMVAKLGESAVALAKSEREGAWREMARQVAHEIKNPLTPMKLSIQYLQKAIDNNQPNVKELSANVANTLVEQIDHLSKIAADFSQFANIGNTNITQFDLHEVIGSLKELYSADENVKMDWNPVNGQVFIEADKTQMNRLFTNLFTNAIDACNGNNDCRIRVSEEFEQGKILISVKDNGEGIAPEMQSRIFVPNFTTKTSGTGLGLAMCKSIVEQAHGRIWFETEQERGTTFYVEFPIVED